MSNAVLCETSIAERTPVARGKVRDIYDLGERPEPGHRVRDAGSWALSPWVSLRRPGSWKRNSSRCRSSSPSPPTAAGDDASGIR